MATATTKPMTWTVPGTGEVLTEEDMEDRRRAGADRYDEVWDGVLHVSPLANIPHQRIVAGLSAILYMVVNMLGRGQVFPGINISDRVKGWRQNYRIPDLAVFLNENPARDCDTHWCGGPDLAVEVRSPGDETLLKIPFYQQIGTRELLVVDRDPWALVLYRLGDAGLVEVARSTPGAPEFLRSEVVPLAFRIVPAGEGDDRPAIEVEYPEADGRVARRTI